MLYTQKKKVGVYREKYIFFCVSAPIKASTPYFLVYLQFIAYSSFLITLYPPIILYRTRRCKCSCMYILNKSKYLFIVVSLNGDRLASTVFYRQILLLLSCCIIPFFFLGLSSLLPSFFSSFFFLFFIFVSVTILYEKIMA